MWTPTGFNVGAPPPSLYVLAEVTPTLQTFSNDTPNAAGMTATGTFSDGLGGTAQNITAIGQSYTDPIGQITSPTGRKVLSASGSPATATLSPSATVTVGSTQPGLTASVVCNLSENVFPIVSASPDPMGRPDLGDGKNQFVYSGDTPDGYLYVPGALAVAGGTSAESQWLINNSPIVSGSDKVDLKIEGAGTTSSAIPNTLTHQWIVSNGTIYVNTPQNINNPYPGYQFNNWIFKGLPSSFSAVADGNHYVNLYVTGKYSQRTKIQTFYPANTSNYPQADADSAIYGYYLPNWFNYFEQAFPNTTTYDPKLLDMYGVPFTGAVAFAQCEGYYDTSVIPNKKIVTNSISKMAAGVLTIGNAPPQGRGVPVFEVSPHTNYLDYIGQLYVKGIYSYLYADGHEQEHIALQTSGDCFAPAYGGNSAAPNPPKDTDGDWLPDAVEGKYHLNPTEADTTGYYTDANRFPEGYAYTNGDTEAICDIAGLHAIVSNPAAWQHDWSDAGVQYGVRPKFFPYEFAPVSTSSPHSSSLPGSAKTSLP